VVNSGKIIRAAEGYLELEMFEDALAELEGLASGARRAGIAAQSLRVRCMMGLKRWAEGAAIARDWVREDTNFLEMYLWGAYCIRRAESLESASEFLYSVQLADVDTSPALPLYWFNLGCYECQRGHRIETLDLVGLAIDAEPSLLELALKDEDLEPVWEELNSEGGELEDVEEVEE
jgi:hypothetical protein